MLTKDEIEKYADILIWGLKKARGTNEGVFKKGDLVRLYFSRQSYDLAEALYKKLILKKWNVIMQVSPSPKMEKDFFTYAEDEQLDFLPPWTLMKADSLQGNIVIYGSENLTNLKDCDPEKIARNAKTIKPFRDILNKNEAIGKFGWTLCLWPSKDMADKAGLSLDMMFDQIRKACFLDKDDPVKEWENLYQFNKNVVKWLDSLDIDIIHVKSENTNLKVKLGDHRTWLSTSGHNIPSFEVFTSPDFRDTNGIYYADQPSYRNGNLVIGAKLKFEHGIVVDCSADVGGEFLKTQVEMDEGSSMVGEFSLTDKRYSNIDKFTANTLFDENFGGEFGNCHIAIGASYAHDVYTGDDELTEERKKKLGFNESALHWDLVNTEPKTVIAYCHDGKKILIYDNGKFMLDE